MLNSKSEDENQQIWDKWNEWKKVKRGTKTHRIIVPIDSEHEIFHCTKSEKPPDGYRWATKEEHERGKRSVIGELDSMGNPSEENRPYYTAEGPYTIGQFNKGEMQYDRKKYTPGGKKKYKETESTKELREILEKRRESEMGWVPPEDYYDKKEVKKE